VFVCWGHAMCTPTRIAGREAVFEFLPENLPFIYIDGVSLARRPHRAPQLSIDISCPQDAQNQKRDGIMGIKCIWSPSTFVIVIFFAGQCDELSASRDLLAEFNGEKGAQDNRKADRHPPHLRSPSTFQS